jgi:hypothetical protein
LSPWRIASCIAAALACAAVGCSGGSATSSSEAGSDGSGSECKPVDVPTSCPSPPPSYKNEIAFIVANDCAGAKCHSDGGGGSVHDFTTYQGIVHDRLTFAQQVALCPMASSGMPPPGSPQPTAEQRLALVTWAGICRAPDN